MSKRWCKGYVSAKCMRDASSRRLARTSSHAVIGAGIWESSDESHCWTKKDFDVDEQDAKAWPSCVAGDDF